MKSRGTQRHVAYYFSCKRTEIGSRQTPPLFKTSPMRVPDNSTTAISAALPLTRLERGSRRIILKARSRLSGRPRAVRHAGLSIFGWIRAHFSTTRGVIEKEVKGKLANTALQQSGTSARCSFWHGALRRAGNPGLPHTCLTIPQLMPSCD